MILGIQENDMIWYKGWIGDIFITAFLCRIMLIIFEKKKNTVTKPYVWIWMNARNYINIMYGIPNCDCIENVLHNVYTFL